MVLHHSSVVKHWRKTLDGWAKFTGRTQKGYLDSCCTLQLCDGNRNQGRPTLRFKDVAKKNMKRDKSQSMAADARNRTSWR